MEINLTSAGSSTSNAAPAAFKRSHGSQSNPSSFTDIMNQVAADDENARESTESRNVRDPEKTSGRRNPEEEVRSKTDPYPTRSRISDKKKGRKAETHAEQAEAGQKNSAQPAQSSPSAPAAAASNPTSGSSTEPANAGANGADGADQVSPTGAIAGQAQTGAAAAALSGGAVEANSTVHAAISEALSGATPATAGAPADPSAANQPVSQQAPASAHPVETPATAGLPAPVVDGAEASLVGTAQPGLAHPTVQSSAGKDSDAVQAGQPRDNAGSTPHTTGASQTGAAEAVQTIANTQAGSGSSDAKTADKDSQGKDQPGSASTLGATRSSLSATITAAAFHVDTTSSLSAPAAKMSGDSTGQGQEIIQQILNQVEPAIRSGKNSLHIQLQPESMGRIDLHMTSTDQGVAVSFRASQPGTQAALENNLSALREALSQAGIQLNHLGVGGHQGQSGSSFADRHPNMASGYGHQKGISGEAEPTVVEKTWKPASMVDYRV
jgi:flagellar hook-length control protein FliK